MEPLNYGGLEPVKSPFDQFVGGLGAGVALSDIQARRQDQELKRQEDERKRQLQLQMQQDLGVLASNPNPTARDYATVMTKYPQISEHLKKGFDILQPEQQAAKVNTATQVYAAINSGANDVAIRLLTEQATALRNSGNEKEAKATETMAKLIEMNPATARTSAGLLLSSVMGADKFATTFPALGRETREGERAQPELRKVEGEAAKVGAEAAIKRLELLNTPEAQDLKRGKTQAEIRDIESNILNRAGELEHKRDTLLTNTEIEKLKLRLKDNEVPEDARKLVNSLAAGVTMKNNQSTRALSLAGRFETMDNGFFDAQRGGWVTTGWNALNRAMGSEGEAQALRQEYSRIRNQNIVATLPPAFNQNFSNTDRQFVEAGIPKEDADPKYIAGFLRATGKLLSLEASADRATAAWVAANQSLSDARRDLVVDGIKVPAGTSFADFTKEYVKRKGDEFNAANSMNQARELGRGYLRYGAPEQASPGMGDLQAP